jgi:hypothetical protein
MNANASVTATFALKSYTLTGTSDPNGSISPSGLVTVNYGASQTFTITPKTGYQILDVKIDGTSAGVINSYTFGNVMSNHTIQATFSAVSPVKPGTVVFALKTGGNPYTSKAGITYGVDRYYSGGRTWRSTAAIAGTEDDPLYRSERYGNFSYAIPLDNRNYTVRLKFAEIYWSSAGKRIFDVKIGGTKVIGNLDIFARVGKNRAYDISIPVTVVDGILKIDFVTIKDNAKVSAILIETR